MIDFIYVLLVFVWLLLALAFVIKDFVLGVITAMALIVLGIYMAVNGTGTISNFMTQTFAIINICLGLYIFLGASLQKIQELI